MAKYRTIQQAYECLKELDAETAITYNALRQMVISGLIPSMRIGKKYLVDLDILSGFFDARGSQEHSLDFTQSQSDV